MNRILVLGATGQLGSRLFKDLENSSGTYFKSMPKAKNNLYFYNVSNFNQLNSIIENVNPNVIINCIGFTNVDKCEAYPEKSWSINTDFAKNISILCKEKRIKFIHISTDHYENIKKIKIDENDDIKILNQYSFSKFFAEKLILKNNTNSIVVRTNFFQFNSDNPKTFLDNLILKATRRQDVSSFSDVVFSPVSIKMLTLFLLELIQIDYSGTIHISSNESISKYDFHDLVLKNFKIDNSTHQSVKFDTQKLLAQRPKYMSLSNSRLVEITSIQMPSINDMIVEECEYARVRSEYVK